MWFWVLCADQEGQRWFAGIGVGSWFADTGSEGTSGGDGAQSAHTHARYPSEPAKAGQGRRDEACSTPARSSRRTDRPRTCVEKPNAPVGLLQADDQALQSRRDGLHSQAAKAPAQSDAVQNAAKSEGGGRRQASGRRAPSFISSSPSLCFLVP